MFSCQVMDKPLVLFVCTYNAARSQLAEGLLRGLFGDRWEAASAGTHPAGVNPYVPEVLAELGIDASGQWSKSVAEFVGRDVDVVVTVCDSANEACPVFGGGSVRLHRGFFDPGTVTGSDAEQREAFRRTRDLMRDWIVEAFGPGGEVERLLAGP